MLLSKAARLRRKSGSAAASDVHTLVDQLTTAGLTDSVANNQSYGDGRPSVPRIHLSSASEQSESSWTSNDGLESSSQPSNGNSVLNPIESAKRGNLSEPETRKSSVSSNNSASSASSANALNPVNGRVQRVSRGTDGSPVTNAAQDAKANRKFWGEDITDDAIYNVYLKKITYSANLVNDSPTTGFSDQLEPDSKLFGKNLVKRKSIGKSSKGSKSNSIDESDSAPTRAGRFNSITKSDQAGMVTIKKPSSNDIKNAESSTQSLQWETRQIRILKAATLEHCLKYILLVTDHQLDQQVNHGSELNHCQSVVIEEERNNVAHVMHIFFS